MSAGNFYIARNSADSTSLVQAGFSADWDTLVKDDGSIVTQTGANLRLDIGIYLIQYAEYFDVTPKTSDSTNRVEMQGEIQANGTTIGGFGQEYIRNDSSNYEGLVNGQMIYEVTANNTDISVKFYRTDDSTKTVQRFPGFGGISILQLDTNHNYGLYSTGSDSVNSGTTVMTMPVTTNDRQDTGFSQSGGVITVTNTGRYLMTYSIDTASANGRDNTSAWISRNGTSTPVVGSYAYTYYRSTDSTLDGALTWAGVVDVNAGDTFQIRSYAPASATVTTKTGSKFQMWQLPVIADSIIIEATTGVYTDDSLFTWDTTAHIDTGSFTHTPGTNNFITGQNDHLLAFGSFSSTTNATILRTVPFAQVSIDGNIRKTAGSTAYERMSGTARLAVNVNGLFDHVASSRPVGIKTSCLSGGGSVTNVSGQFSAISLESIWNYTYTFPIGISDVDIDEVIGNIQTNVIITGNTFGAIQGTGKVELVENLNYTGTIITQSIDTWSDISIQFDVVPGALADSYCYLFVTADSGSVGYIPIQVGVPPETYQQAVEGMTVIADHYWRFQSSYTDELGLATANNTSGGTPTFVTNPLLVKGDSHSLLLNSTIDYISPADQADMNVTISANRRYVGGWIQLDSVSQTLSVIWEEGAQVNNFALLNGFGNNPIFQFADANGDYVQAYFDIPLTPNRPYHILGEFNASGYKLGICGVHLDGVFQSRSDGNPWEVSQFPSHSGNISWGHEGTEDLKVGDDRGVDATVIEFTSPVSCNYAHWYSWSDVTLDNAADIRITLFEKGAPADVTIQTDIESVMQASIDAISDTLFLDWPCSLEVKPSTSGNLTLTLDNINFEDRVSMQIRYTGADTLTLIAINGTVLDSTKIGTPYGGTVIVETPTAFTINGLINGCEFRIYDNNGNGTSSDFGTELSGIETLSGTSYQYSHDGATNDIVVQMIVNGYEELIIPFALNSNDQTLTLIPKQDSNA